MNRKKNSVFYWEDRKERQVKHIRFYTLTSFVTLSLLVYAENKLLTSTWEGDLSCGCPPNKLTLFLTRCFVIWFKELSGTCSQNENSSGLCIRILNVVSNVISLLTSSSSSHYRANPISPTNIFLLISSLSRCRLICCLSNPSWNASMALIDTHIGKTLGIQTLSRKTTFWCKFMPYKWTHVRKVLFLKHQNKLASWKKREEKKNATLKRVSGHGDVGDNGKKAQCY